MRDASNLTLAKVGTGVLRALIFLLLILVVLEMSARVWFLGMVGLDPRRVPVFRSIDPNLVFKTVSDPIISYTYKPQLREFRGLVRFETDPPDATSLKHSPSSSRGWPRRASRMPTWRAFSTCKRGRR